MNAASVALNGASVEFAERLCQGRRIAIPELKIASAPRLGCR